MKIFRRITFIICVVSLLAGCTTSGSNSGRRVATDMELYNTGTEIISVMDDMVQSDEYAKIMGVENLGTIPERVNTGDYDSPISVYRIILPDFEEFLKLSGMLDLDSLNELSPKVKKQIEKRVYPSGIITSLNAAAGSDAIAFDAAYTVSEKNDTLYIENATLLLYVFEKGTPIIIAFNQEGGISGHFVFIEDIKTIADVTNIFEEPCVVREIALD